MNVQWLTLSQAAVCPDIVPVQSDEPQSVQEIRWFLDGLRGPSSPFNESSIVLDRTQYGFPVASLHRLAVDDTKKEYSSIIPGLTFQEIESRGYHSVLWARNTLSAKELDKSRHFEQFERDRQFWRHYNDFVLGMENKPLFTDPQSNEYQMELDDWLTKQIHSKGGRRWTEKRSRTISPLFEYGIEYPAQEALVSGAPPWGGEDVIFSETQYNPRLYPQESLSDDEDLVERKESELLVSPTSPAFESTHYPSASMHANHKNAQITTKIFDMTNGNRPPQTQQEIDEQAASFSQFVDDFRSGLDEGTLKYDLRNRSENARTVAMALIPGAEEFGRVVDSDITRLALQSFPEDPEREGGELKTLCLLCKGMDMSLVTTDVKQDGRPGIKMPKISIDACGYEVTFFAPSLNRMLLNCKQGSCAQCLLLCKLLVSTLSLNFVSGDEHFNREALVPFYLAVPVGRTQQYLELMSEEIHKPVSQPLLAPEVIVRPPYKCDPHAYHGHPEELSLWIEQSTLPLENMQGSGRLLDGNGIDPSQFKIWWEQCQSTHSSHCHVSPGHAYMGFQATGYLLRVVDVVLGKVVSAPTGCKYVALSYVWPRTTDNFKAQTSFLQRPDGSACKAPARDDEEACLEFPMERLPKTIQDALQVVRILGERYLWIDALCIVQDDKEDVRRTVHRMDEIYKAALLTIIMGDREGVALQAGRPDLEQLSQRIGNAHYIKPLPSLNTELNKSIWDSRGWTYQEGVFSTRKLVFVNDRVFYSCNHSTLQEDYTTGPFRTNISASGSRPAFSLTSSRFAPENAYCSHVEAFTMRNLSYGGDIINAFSGILHSMETQLHTEFCWGLPLSDFDGALLWHGKETFTRRVEKTDMKESVGSVHFPSWSWAGWKGAVRYRPDYHSDNRRQVTPDESAANRLGHITTLITWPWNIGFDVPSVGLDLKQVVHDLMFRGILRFVTSVASIKVQRLRRFFAQQGIDGWKLDDGTTARTGWIKCIVLSEKENPQIYRSEGRSPIMTYNALVVEEDDRGFLERKGLVKISRKIWESCQPEIRWVTLI